MKAVYSNTSIDKASRNVLRIKLSPGEKTEIIKVHGGSYTLHAGVNKKTCTPQTFTSLCRKIVKKAKEQKHTELALQFEDFVFPVLEYDPHEVASLLMQHFEMANYEFSAFKSKGSQPTFVKKIIIHGKINKAIKDGIKKGLLIGQEVNRSRDLANTPGGDITPSILAQKARESVKGLPVTVKTLDTRAMTKLKMGAILGVSKGSIEKPSFIIMEYKGGNKSEKPIVLVGKGVTYDTGGLSLKPSDAMLGMHLDMSGGASVIHTIALAARLKLKKNIVVLVPAVENMVSGESFRPGDILRSMSGTTIEVLNTDAEGRLVLADALTYAKRYDPRLVIDVATLTGAAVVALGEDASAIFTKDKTLSQTLQDMSERIDDRVWPLPLWDVHEKDIQGTFADISNLHSKGSRYGGASHAAAFLYHFAKSYPWVHIDIAPRMTESSHDNLSKGSIGAPIRLLTTLLESY